MPYRFLQKRKIQKRQITGNTHSNTILNILNMVKNICGVVCELCLNAAVYANSGELG